MTNAKDWFWNGNSIRLVRKESMSVEKVRKPWMSSVEWVNSIVIGRVIVLRISLS